MLQRMIWLCGAEWLIGFSGMWIARGLFQLSLDDPLFGVFAHVWFIGGLGFVLLGLLSLLQTVRRP